MDSRKVEQVPHWCWWFLQVIPSHWWSCCSMQSIAWQCLAITSRSQRSKVINKRYQDNMKTHCIDIHPAEFILILLAFITVRCLVMVIISIVWILFIVGRRLSCWYPYPCLLYIHVNVFCGRGCRTLRGMGCFCWGMISYYLICCTICLEVGTLIHVPGEVMKIEWIWSVKAVWLACWEWPLSNVAAMVVGHSVYWLWTVLLPNLC